MPIALSIVWEVIRNNKKSKQFAELLEKFDEVLGLDLINSEKYQQKELPQEVKELLEKRKQARIDKNWDLSDKLRDELQKMGYIVKDTKNGQEIQ